MHILSTQQAYIQHCFSEPLLATSRSRKSPYALPCSFDNRTVKQNLRRRRNKLRVRKSREKRECHVDWPRDITQVLAQALRAVWKVESIEKQHTTLIRLQTETRRSKVLSGKINTTVSFLLWISITEKGGGGGFVLFSHYYLLVKTIINSNYRAVITQDYVQCFVHVRFGTRAIMVDLRLAV